MKFMLYRVSYQGGLNKKEIQLKDLASVVSLIFLLKISE